MKTTIAEPKRKRRWLQFSLRTFLALVLVTSVGLACVAARQKRVRDQQAAVEEIRAHRGTVEYGLYPPSLFGGEAQSKTPPGPEWLTRLLGEDFFRDVKSVGLIGESFFRDAKSVALGGGDASLEHVERFDRLERLSLWQTHVTDTALDHIRGLGELKELRIIDSSFVTDAGLANLDGLMQLQVLTLVNCKITDAGLDHIVGLTQLKELDLSGSEITDDGLARLTALRQLQNLGLGGTAITDAGLVHLAAFPQLKRLSVRKTKVTDAGLAHIEKLTQLEHFSFIETQVTNAGLSHLAGLSKLKTLCAMQTGVTEEGVAQLKSVFPKIQVGYSAPRKSDR